MGKRAYKIKYIKIAVYTPFWYNMIKRIEEVPRVSPFLPEAMKGVGIAFTYRLVDVVTMPFLFALK